ncbi:MAG: DUF2079 domain-containing protein [Thermoleophilia bacterium]
MIRAARASDGGAEESIGPFHERRFRALLAAQVAVLAVLYAAVGLLRHATYRSTGFDLGIFDQAIWQLARLQAPASSLKGLPSLFGDHFSPILVALAPLGACDCGPAPLIVAQALLVAASVWPVVLFARPRLGSGPALLLGTGYGLFAGIQSAVAFDMHEVAFAPLLIAWAALLASREQWRRALLCVLALLLVKEDLAFLVIAFGAWFALQRRPREGLVCLAAGALWYAGATRVAIPHFADGKPFSYWSYEQIGDTPAEALRNVFAHPLQTAKVFVTPGDKLRTLAALFGAFAFLPLLSIDIVLAAPLLAERMLSSNAKYWTLQDHYSLTIAPVLAIGAARALPFVVAVAGARWRRSRGWPLKALVCAGIAAIGLASCAAFPLGDLARPGSYAVPEARRGAPDALKLIPPAASVAATNHLVPHLSQRETIVLFGPGQRRVQYVVAQTGDRDPTALFPYATPSQQRAALRRLRGSHRLVHAAGGVQVWSRRPAR